MRIACLLMSLIGLTFLFVPSSVNFLDSLGRHYISHEDNYWSSQEGTLAAWNEIASLGNIGRHHRYAVDKSRIWRLLLEADTKLETMDRETQKSFSQWLEKNKRDLNMSLVYAKFQYQNGEIEKAIAGLIRVHRKFPSYRPIEDVLMSWIEEERATGGFNDEKKYRLSLEDALPALTHDTQAYLFRGL